jgi:hypothetical protein
MVRIAARPEEYIDRKIESASLGVRAAATKNFSDSPLSERAASQYCIRDRRN